MNYIVLWCLVKKLTVKQVGIISAMFLAGVKNEANPHSFICVFIDSLHQF